MLHCDKCGVDVTGAPTRCPLCGSELTGAPDPAGGQFVPLPGRARERYLVLKIITMAALSAIIISLAVDYLIGGAITWSLFAAGGAVCAWIFTVIGWRKRKALAKNIFWQTTIVTLAGIVWDLGTGWHGWRVDFLIPCACVAAILAIGTLAVVLSMETSDYMIYLLIVSVYGLVPLILLLTRQVGIRYPSVICVALSLLTVVGLMVFYHRNTVDELQKKFHF